MERTDRHVSDSGPVVSEGDAWNVRNRPVLVAEDSLRQPQYAVRAVIDPSPRPKDGERRGHGRTMSVARGVN